MDLLQGLGKITAAAHADWQIPCPALQGKAAGRRPTPPVETPAIPPTEATHITQRVLQPV